MKYLKGLILFSVLLSFSANALLEVSISCLVENRSGTLATIANILANLGVNIENIEQRDKPNAKKLIGMVIVVANIIQLNNVLDKLKGLPHIVSTSRN